ncbi:MAG TPA: hypothetical protein VMQ73_10320 [Methylomirabilota bacterium]|nr:hypothetical protein [Methylomirabilota bacterium]
MARKPKPASSAGLSPAELAWLRAAILKPPRHIVTDPIDMEHILDIDVELGKQLIAQRLETQAELNRIIAEGAAKAAKMLK